MRSPSLFMSALLACACASPAWAQTAPPAPAAGFAGIPTVSVSAEARVQRAPDVAEITAGVVTDAPAAAAAMQANARQMSGVVTALQRAGVADRDVQTSGLDLQPQYVYGENQPPRLTGYRASNNVRIRLRKLADVGKVIDALVAQGANQISGPSFRLDDPEPALDEARVEAMRRARARADLYARAAGLSVGRVLQITEDTGVRSPQPMRAMRVSAEAADAATPVAPGEVDLGATVSVTYALQ
jgi:uncharacterized protein YggE